MILIPGALALSMALAASPPSWSEPQAPYRIHGNTWPPEPRRDLLEIPFRICPEVPSAWGRFLIGRPQDSDDGARGPVHCGRKVCGHTCRGRAVVRDDDAHSG